jgi:Vitamin K-dependent gamma-carboxylase
MRGPAFLFRPVSIAPLVTFRLIFGAMMLFSTLRFWYLGWIEDHYINVKFTFKYFGFEFVELLPPWGMYALHIVLIISALGVLLGAFYRWSAAVLFLSFTYCQLIDLTYYLNHYYFVSWVCFLLIWVPAHRSFSLDVKARRVASVTTVEGWNVLIFKAQIAIVYFYAGLIKINPTWLFEALPLKIWLPANDKLPLIGGLMSQPLMPYVFSWCGMLYDTFIVGFLVWPRTRLLAYATVIVFHTLTGILFQIGVFPLVMIGGTLIFFSDSFHQQLLQWLGYRPQPVLIGQVSPPNRRPWKVLFWGLYCLFQLLFPWRFLCYDGNLFWTEQGYRFGWRVMLMEKAGTATFYVKDRATGREGVVNNADFLTPHQEKQMAMQPDMILQYAHFLQQHYQTLGLRSPQVRAEVYVTLNGRPSRLYFDPQLDLTQIQDSWQEKKWIFSYNK